MLRDIRKQYLLSRLLEDNIVQNPIEQFDKWLQEAVAGKEEEPTGMVLSTVDDQLQPHARVVLLKDFSSDGFVFFSNYSSHKAEQMAEFNKVSLLFFWQTMERQVRIIGSVEKLSDSMSTEYFSSRPFESKVAAWASPQSKIIENYEYLELRFAEFKKRFDNEVPKPPHWGGYLVKPRTIEFWQGRPNRLHDRILYTYSEDKKSWVISRLAP